jgi:phosphoglycolate phosphatase
VSNRLVVFDLDGTLIDGYAGITDALGFAMERLGQIPIPEARVRRMVGEGLDRLLEKAVGSADAAQGLRFFRERYEEVAVSGSRPMPGVPGALVEIAGAGWRMAVASNKPPVYSRRILETLGLSRFFFAVAGPGPVAPPKPDPAMLRRLIADAGAAATDTVAVGDMEIDAQFARAAGCRIVLIPGGSRTVEELAAEEPDALLESLGELPSWLRRLSRMPVPPSAGSRGRA